MGSSKKHPCSDPLTQHFVTHGVMRTDLLSPEKQVEPQSEIRVSAGWTERQSRSGM